MGLQRVRPGEDPGNFEPVGSRSAVAMRKQPATLAAVADEEVANLFLRVVQTPEARISGGAITGLSSGGLTDYTGNLLRKGIVVLRRLADASDRVRVG